MGKRRKRRTGSLPRRASKQQHEWSANLPSLKSRPTTEGAFRTLNRAAPVSGGGHAQFIEGPATRSRWMLRQDVGFATHIVSGGLDS